jgi:transposase
VLSRILFVIRNGLRWRDAPAAYGPDKTIYDRFIRWSRLGVFNRILAELAAQGGSAIGSRTCSLASKTGGAFTLDTTDALTLSYQP